ncbi:membrane protein|nr:membrane protein [Candidatus Pantoea persica]
MREITVALGLTSLGGHPQMVRPLLAPITSGSFLGEDIFVAFGAIIFMHNFMLESANIQTEPLHIAVWGYSYRRRRLSYLLGAAGAAGSRAAGAKSRRAESERRPLMFQQQYLMWLVVAVLSWRDSHNPRRLTTGLFWALYGLIFLVGDWTTSLMTALTGTPELGARYLHIIIGVLVVAMALIAGFGGVRLGRHHQRSDEEKQTSARRLGNRLLLPALAIPVVTVIGVLAFNHIPGLQEAVFGAGNHATLVTLFSMTLGCLLCWLIALKLTHEKPVQSMQDAPSAGRHRLGLYYCRRSSPPSACCSPAPFRTLPRTTSLSITALLPSRSTPSV